MTARQPGWEWAEPLRLLVAAADPAAEPLVLGVANRKPPAPAGWSERFPPADARRMARQVAWHDTPAQGAWLHSAEGELRGLARQCLARRLPEGATLPRAGAAWAHKRTQAHVTIDGRCTTAAARSK